ncbi:hypothetical protein L228DRAFT_261177 [Xylona heveae TC161]|uniref:DUF8032 domain-containing protein n=1 Tax=Xylona heveae (strain CBS 132557 / TC161) TaxID=1328760 RepID=A0A165H754_XYLHT|nr:hypothetical protein L228DRAFT_261177 [Xylona heveae TC161]KZF23080.1 hypothetical protein L228DRAFT_261177 [Xylona heveae TC161]
MHHPHHSQQGPPPPLHIQHSRPPSIVPPQSQLPPTQPLQSHHQGAFRSPHAATHGPSQHAHQPPPPPSSFAQTPSGPGGHQPSENAFFSAQPSPYSTSSVTGAYSSAETPDLMAAAHMNRPAYPPIYHTPQSNSPASVASPQSHDQHGRSLYAQPPPQLPHTMYAGYPQYPPMAPTNPSPYAQHPAPQQHPLSSQPLLMSHPQAPPQLQHPTTHSPVTAAMNQSPRTKLAQAPLQRPPSGVGASSTPVSAPPSSANGGMHGNQSNNPAVNPNAAPGPIPATTPLVVRQDNNGVQWIAFEYSRDRVKMEYTIRCDVESVNVDSLSQEFKTENCVYPRACCAKDQYRGNRLVYETECNTVGWALAELNPCLRGKRGLIQRAVDSWRNSNQDPRLRSRRVRRMAKINNRRQVASTQHPNHMAGPSGPGPAAPVATPAAGSARPVPGPPLAMGGAQLHHHHAQHDATAPAGSEDVSVGSHNSGVRHNQVFHGYANYPTNSSVGPSMPPSVHDGVDHMSRHGAASAHATATASAVATKSEDDETVALFGDVPEAKRRKFILVDDPHRGTRVRVRVTLDQVEMNEIPDSYRKTNSVYPRSYFPMQMQSPPSTPRGSRFFDDEEDSGEDGPTKGRTIVPVPMLDGSEVDVPTPCLGKRRRSKELTLNDMGYRMSWSQSRVFAGRTIFLQRALDAYRNKMRSTMVAAGQDVSTVPPHFETRVGKRKWMERDRRSKRHSSP